MKAKIEEWANHGLALHGLTSSIEKTFGSNPESPIHDIPWKIFSSYTKELSVSIGKDDHAAFLYDLEWFAWECDLGRKPMGAKLSNGKEVLVNGVEALVEILNDSIRKA